VAAAVAHRPELCLLDVEMPGSGITAAREIAELVPETHVVMLTVSRDGRDVEASLAAGARGFVLKDVPSERLDAALRAVLDGELVTPGSGL
jgi:DNA-binding NarL/FixJ family response regulator